jgi:hypothetical protein
MEAHCRPVGHADGGQQRLLLFHPGPATALHACLMVATWHTHAASTPAEWCVHRIDIGPAS